MKSVEDAVYDGSLDWNKHTGERWIETNFALKGSAPSFVEGETSTEGPGRPPASFFRFALIPLEDHMSGVDSNVKQTKSLWIFFPPLPAASLVFA